ncbi:MAG TPA: DNA ligase D [Solirubrobacteraceae bacterium]|jgi:bifunctional non-homologous end joining protein LigD
MSVTDTARSRDLGEYRRKRSFAQTPEPVPEVAPEPGEDVGVATARFVVHEHHARRLHWDLRLEHDGALASWAIPNGIPEDPAHNRKAIHVENHPLSYIDFEGTIPAGNYGAGEVIVWDRGTYACEKWRSQEVIVVFHGERLRGRYALFHAGASPKDWMIHRMDPPLDPTATEMPERVEPMQARLSTLPRDESEWAFEVKWDGVRAIVYSQPGRLRLESRNGNDVTPAYPELRALNRALGSRAAILDGEIIAFDESGRPSFEALQPRMHQRGEATVRRLMGAIPVTYVVFDLLWLDGHSLMELPYAQRRERLQELGLAGGHWRTPELQVGDGTGLLAATRELGMEGVVGKRLDARYTPGRRDGGWIKIKHHRRQELVIGGWTEGKGARGGRIGALELGVYDERGELRHAGRVGTGFDESELERLADLLAPLAQDGSPFTGPQPPRGARFVAPRLVCEVEFSEWTRAGKVRQASYKGLREDKDPAEVIRELEHDPEWPPTDVSRDLASTGTASAIGEVDEPAISGNTETVAKTTAPRKTRAPGKTTAPRRGRAPSGTGAAQNVEVQGRALRLTNLDKVLYPRTGFTKGDLIGYYSAIAPVLLAHLRDRPLTLKRYPDGVQGEHFYEKQCPAHRPEWVQTTAVWSGRTEREIDYCLCQDLPTLVWLGNLADLELHPSLSYARELERPSTLAFDLDPGPPAGVVQCCEVALQLRDVFAELGLWAFAKTSGLTGMQVYVPLNRDEASYEQTKPFARAVADVLAHSRPRLVVSHMAKAARRGRVLIDWSQNDEHKTTVCVYSPRAGETPTVSTPVTWEEVAACREADDPALLTFAPVQVLDRVREHGDLFAEVVSLRQTLPALGG